MEDNNLYDQANTISVFYFEFFMAAMLRVPIDEKEQLVNYVAFTEGSSWLINEEDPDIESAQGIVELLEGTWDEISFKEYIKVPLQSRYEYLTNVKGINVYMFGFVMGIKAAIKSTEELIKLLECGKSLADIYIGFDTPGEFLKMNSDDLDYSRNAIFNDLVIQFTSEATNGFSNIDQLRKTEKLEFEMLFMPYGKTHDWTYLADRMGIEIREVEELYEYRKHIDNGLYVGTYYSFDRDQRLTYAFLFAIRDYLEFLGSEKSLDVNVSTSRLNKSFPNLALRKEFHKNLESAYELLKNEFIISDFETFCGIFIPGTFIGKVKISAHATVAELKLFLIKIEDYINGYSKKWKHANSLFEFADGKALTVNSFNTAKINSVFHAREKQISLIADEIKKR